MSLHNRRELKVPHHLVSCLCPRSPSKEHCGQEQGRRSRTWALAY